MGKSNIKYIFYINVFGDCIWIGIDDTDSLRGGCTTYLACKLVEILGQNGFWLVGYPRLVRLNPNVPWKTRGNGAIAFQIGKKRRSSWCVGESAGKKIFSGFGKVDAIDAASVVRIKEIVSSVIDAYGRIDDDTTNPGAVLIDSPPPEQLYWDTVSEIMELSQVHTILDELDATTISYKNGRGLIGATAAIAWSATNDVTYELITYRDQKRWGTVREVDEGSVKQLDQCLIYSFDNYDYVHAHNRITPNSPCPVLYGVRGDVAEELIQAVSIVKSEPVAAWMVFLSNQGTDDHLLEKRIADIQPFQSVMVTGHITSMPETKVGGHVFVNISDGSNEICCAAYEPTKEFRMVVRELVPGDKVTVCGGVREVPLTINLEKIFVHELVSLEVKVENPVCPVCGKHMKSVGMNQGYRCRKCGKKSAMVKKDQVFRSVKPGWYEVPVCARRHLSKPIKRFQNVKNK